MRGKGSACTRTGSGRWPGRADLVLMGLRHKPLEATQAFGPFPESFRRSFIALRPRKHMQCTRVHLQGPPEAAVEAFRLLVSTTAPMGLTPSLPKCAAHAAPPAPTALHSSLGGWRFTTRCPASCPRSFRRSPRPSLPRFSCTLSGSTAATSRTRGLRTCWPPLRPRLKAPDSGLAFTPVHADQLPSGWTPCPPPSL
jgi:hypothetical protein